MYFSHIKCVMFFVRIPDVSDHNSQAFTMTEAQLRIKILFFYLHDVMRQRTELKFHEARRSCRNFATTTVFITS